MLRGRERYMPMIVAVKRSPWASCFAKSRTCGEPEYIALAHCGN